MTDEEIERYAKHLLNEYYEKYKLQDLTGNNIDNQHRDDDFLVSVSQSENGEIEFNISANRESTGRFSVKYSPQLAVEGIIRYCVQEASMNQPDKAEIKDLWSFWKSEIETAVEFLYRSIPFEIYDTFERNIGLQFHLVARHLETKEFATNEFNAHKDNIKKILSFINEGREARLLIIFEAAQDIITAPTYLFADIYDEEYKKWKEVETFYKKIKKQKGINIKKAIKSAFEDKYKLDEDLIDWLFSLDRYKTNPSSIGLESAARIANLPMSKRTKDSLPKVLNASRKERREITDEIAIDLLDQFRKGQEVLKEDYRRKRELVTKLKRLKSNSS